MFGLFEYSHGMDDTENPPYRILHCVSESQAKLVAHYKKLAVEDSQDSEGNVAPIQLPLFDEDKVQRMYGDHFWYAYYVIEKVVFL